MGIRKPVAQIPPFTSSSTRLEAIAFLKSKIMPLVGQIIHPEFIEKDIHIYFRISREESCKVTNDEEWVQYFEKYSPSRCIGIGLKVDCPIDEEIRKRDFEDRRIRMQKEYDSKKRRSREISRVLEAASLLCESLPSKYPPALTVAWACLITRGKADFSKPPRELLKAFQNKKAE
eukprot:gnl/Carplike_NY0171/4996_a6818_315.p1 GENE.gnl/Carplike_NY0171/4996_a6818_315~~gnl/Carplike_NY0171/4996_a6818_315.p1  ORF type:complete len:205 (+),score=19.69 gnl/Carplike_NY0171/4996_a6818_315:91-615(+)